MSDPSADTARPVKRARLEDTAAPAPSTSASIASSTTAPIPTAPASIDTDLEREVRAGITQYVSPDHLGFTGVLKQRYTDFLVNEIGLDGGVVHLKSLNMKRKEGKKPHGKEANLVENEPEGEAGGLGPVTKIIDEGDDEGVRTEPIKVEPALDQTIPVPEQQTGENEQVKKAEDREELSEQDRTTLHSIFGEDTTKLLLALVRQVRKGGNKKAKEFKAVIAPPITDKERRTEAHKCLRRIFPNLLESTMEPDQSIRIKATPPAERGGRAKGGNQGRRDPAAGRQRGQTRWEDLGGDFLHFTLYKENKDTMEVVSFLGSKLNCGPKGFGFAGTKDRRACTSQRVSVRRQTADRMYSFNKVLFNAAIGDFEYHTNELKLGDLKGNEFTITLRNCHFESEDSGDASQRLRLANEVVGKAIRDFSDCGFINYYGLQRFGSFATSTDAIGRKMLQNDLEGAVADLLAYNPVALTDTDPTSTFSPILISQDDRKRAQALHLWHTTGSGTAALDLLPRKFTAERNIIQHLSSRNSKSGQHDRKTDWQGALMTIPRNLRLMYVHAYQSLVWNVVAGHRWRTYGSQVVEGDLVLVSEHGSQQTTSSTNNNNPLDQNGEPIIDPSGTENANAAASDFERARPLSAAEAGSGAYTIYDIVLPQPGFDVEYPRNKIGAFYTEFMASERGGGLDPHDMRRSWREISLSGGYRKVLARPLTKVGHEVYEYVKEDEQFVETDLQRLGKGRTSGERKGEEEDVSMEDGEAKEEQAKKIAVVLRLQLASSQYATMALRELMKAGGAKAYKPEYMGGR
ncbi:similar to pseudouridine synthase TruD/Pus7 [Plenodomus lingam JN3]|uniref:Similar to pseudouridine synthase TruD/Pus7 n=2 Tax=Leptosphaeria maculans TaxID=5022 RepID=E5A772_LEPMJ|nr:similar to pseudouridine synthase TruD/Pus7 [Plenodomus lingam JN3]CBX99467.1 similar to pseudouridine synthase TruD/Pus7 [Plenodomus lingam JN3]